MASARQTEPLNNSASTPPQRHLHHQSFKGLTGADVACHSTQEKRAHSMDISLEGARHMKGKQVAVTLYLSPHKYWQLKALSHRHRVSMQKLLRQALEEVLRDGQPVHDSLRGAATLPEPVVSAPPSTAAQAPPA